MNAETTHDLPYYASLCVKEFPSQSLLRLRPDLRDRPCVVMDGEPPLEQVCSFNRMARSLGVTYGMTRVEAETFPHMTILPRSAHSEAAAKDVLLECIGAFSPHIEDCGKDGIFLCGIDITGTGKLFGPRDSLARNLWMRVNNLTLVSSIAVSHNFNAALSTAKALTARNPIMVIPVGKEREVLASLPLTVLDLTEAQAELFSGWGIRSLGMLASLPEKELIERIGQAGKRLRQLAYGECPHLFQPIVTAFALKETVELDSSVELLDPLLFMVNTLLEQLTLRAAARALALASVTITLRLDDSTQHVRTIHPALPTNDRKLWIKLLHLDLETHPPKAPVVEITIESEPGETSKIQLGLFSPQFPEPSRLDITLARIRSMVGAENVGKAVLKDTHTPDAYSLEQFELPSGDLRSDLPVPLRPATRRLRPAEPVLVSLQNGRLSFVFFRNRKYAVERLYGPWRKDGEWWNSKTWESEEWDLIARTSEAQTLCGCLMRDIKVNRWLMVALYD